MDVVRLACALLASLVPAGQPELIERTMAIVGGQAITLSDARAAVAFGLVDVGRSVDPDQTATARLVDRELMLREVRRYAPPQPSDAAIDTRMADLKTMFASPAAFTRALEVTGLTEARLRAWIRDDLRTQAYLAQRFASASAPTDAEISRAYAQQKAELDAAGTTFDQAVPILRERLITSRRRELIADWVSDLRRRTDVILLVQ
jgi:hypothetical protein